MTSWLVVPNTSSAKHPKDTVNMQSDIVIIYTCHQHALRKYKYINNIYYVQVLVA